MAPVYFAMGGVIFVREHAPISLERAHFIAALHRANANYQLGELGDERSRTARLALAKTEQALADEMSAAIRDVRAAQPQEIAA